MTFGMLPISMSSRNERHLAPSETWREQKALQPTPRSFTFSRRAAPPTVPRRTCLRAGCPGLPGRAADLAPGFHSDGQGDPKDVDVLLTIDMAMDLTRLARSGRRLMGQAQTINLGADIFLADTTGRYLGRICHYRECHPRVLCHAQHCGQRDHLNDDLHIVTLSQELIASPPIELWPKVIRRLSVPLMLKGYC
jgi:hypothetical protein